MRIGLAFRAFWAALTRSELSQSLEKVLDGLPPGLPPAATSVTKAEVTPKKPSSAGGRSDALTLLATLQREARLLDLVHESLDAYSDAQVGAAARDCLRDCRKTLQRLFDIKPLSPVAEGDSLTLPDQVSGVRYRVAGSGPASAGSRGQVVHAGWEASHCQLPSWTGQPQDSLILAPIEVEVR